MTSKRALKELLLPVLLIVLLALTNLACQQAPAGKADLIIAGKIFTGLNSRPFVEALAASGDKILATGSRQEINRYAGPQTRIIELAEGVAIPGLIDAHTHFSSGGQSLIELSFRGVDSIEKVQQMIAARIKELPPGTPIFGRDYDHTLFPDQKWPDRADLDKVSPDNPVVIRRVDGHSAWLNTLALKLSGIDGLTPDPFGGEIVRDQISGDPTGILKESAMNLIKIEPSIKSSPEEDILRALDHARQLGLTGVHASTDLKELEIYKKLKKEGQLTLRIYAWLPIEEMDECLKLGLKQGQGDEFLKIGFLKAFIDGTLGSGTALMFEPFADAPGQSGLAQYSEQEFYELIDRAYAHGFQVGTHAIGDKGVNWVLNAIEKAEKKYGQKDLRYRIEHAQIIKPEDIKRFRGLGVIASMQPTHCTTDMRFCEQRIGQERSKDAYAWKSLLDNGASLAFGSDWPVEPLDPRRGLYSAVTRQNIEQDLPEGGWFPEQKLTLAEAIECFTSGSAYASFEENLKGTLEPGKLADLTIFGLDIFSHEPEDILTAPVIYTIVGGKIVYQAEGN
ncbi:MAG TPA: amidohydrolase [Candidatus Saccharicenans sp.]|mgnify:CR=1 FL=1|nr:amidohydrolase [Candidatus Saccharicenans sp.]HPB59250.1 amidohydrolase [Candidatus Saccharicenans sp.]HUM79438.1 amidohydrolase [Candidatus Saccharicenans sp.]